METTLDPNFEEQLKSLEKEIRLHCYRLTGSLQDSEDMLQESLIKAWKKRDTLNDEARLRPWLYRIATNVCLDQLKHQKRRQISPAYLPAADPNRPFPAPDMGAAWIEPYPDQWLPGEGGEPERQILESESVSLAFLTSIQYLAPQQRAALILVDVLDWSAEETAEMLGKSLSSVNSLLYRARRKLRDQGGQSTKTSISAEEQQALLNQYMSAWESSDAEALSRLLTEDAIFHMPPFPAWYSGRVAIREMVEGQLFIDAENVHWSLRGFAANGQAGFLLYRQAEIAADLLFGLMVLRFEGSAIAEITAFLDPRLLASFSE